MMPTPDTRIQRCNEAPLRPQGQYVLYWMTAFRRLGWNFSLQRAAELATQWNKPLLVLEALRCDYAWTSERFHRFVMQGMADNARRARALPIRYYAYVEP